MNRSYFLAAWRSLLKARYFSLLNIVGLALGVASSILIFQYVGFHLSFDGAHENADRIYRITYSKEKEGEQVFNTVLVYAGVGGLMKNAFPEVEDYCRMRPLQMANPKGPVRYGDVAFEEEGVYWTDANFFTFFSHPLVKGDPVTALREQFTAVVSESIARKYFGNEEPIGKTLRVGQQAEVTVTGVFKDVPANSHLKFRILVSHTTLKPLMPPWWNDDNLQLFHGHLYVLLKPGTDVQSLAAKFPRFVDDHINGHELRKTGVELKYAIMPLKDIHLHSHIQHEAEVNGDIRIVNYMSIIGLIILFIAWINYINLATSRALERAKEVGIRKVVGAYRGHLILQFLLESFVVNLVAVLIAVVIVFFAQPVLSGLGAGDAREFDWFANYKYLIYASCIFVVGVFASGFYPAVVLSGFKPVSVLRGKFSNTKFGVWSRKALVVVQFAASVALLIGTATIYRQIQFLRDQDLGFDINQTLVVKAPLVTDSTFQTRTLSFKDELREVSSLRGVTASFSVPSMEPGGASWFSRAGDNPDNVQFCYQTWVDETFIPVFDIKIIEGRNFVGSNQADSMAIIINEVCLPLFDFKHAAEAIGSRIAMGEEVYNVIGVAQNYQQKSLKVDYIPIIISYRPDVKGFYSLKIEGGNRESVANTIAGVERKWKAFFPDNPFIYFFLDDEFGRQYAADEQFGKLFTFFSFVAIFIGCLGLLGLSSYTVIKRTKEIGIRKILGSSVTQLVQLLTKEFIVLIAISNILAWPVVMLLMDSWLGTFAHRISMGIEIFAISALAIFVIALGSVSLQVIKASRANPVNCLRSE